MKLETVLHEYKEKGRLANKLNVLDRICSEIDDQYRFEENIDSDYEEELFDRLMSHADAVFDALTDLENKRDEMVMYYSEKLDDLSETAKLNLDVYLLAHHMEKILDLDYQPDKQVEGTWH